MLRTFDTHDIREIKELGGIWKMQKLSAENEILQTVFVTVPSCWESIRGFENYRGRCKYIKEIETKGGNYRLVFKGVSHTADVFVDGIKMTHHYNAYTPFEVLLKNLSEGKHTIEVIADNRFSEESALHVSNDYRSYGGISRPVAIERLKDAFIRYAHFTTSMTEKGWEISAKCEVLKLTDKKTDFSLRILIEDAVIDLGNLKFDEGGSCTVGKTVLIPSVEEWCPENPKLYKVVAILSADGVPADDLIERIGFREVKVSGSSILLNGRQIYIKGFNRHEDYGTFGCAIPEIAMQTDIDIILSTGANLIRTSHYPNDERFLDMCDERGVLVWEESHARHLNAKQMLNPNFRKQSADCIDEMITNHYNHPSIIIWGILNECDGTDEYGRECYALQFEQIKRLDSTRPTTAATFKYFDDLCYDLPDIVSINIYPRWYNNREPLEEFNQIKEHINTHGGAGKPLLISECGAGAVYGYRGFSEVKWTEDRQAAIIKELLEKLCCNPDNVGVILWQFSDCRVDDGFFAQRPNTRNNKGIVDVYRQPKISYYTVCEQFKKIETYKGGTNNGKNNGN